MVSTVKKKKKNEKNKKKIKYNVIEIKNGVDRKKRKKIEK